MEDVVLENAVVRLMRGDYREWLQGLSPEEANALRKYSRNSIRNNVNFYLTQDAG